MGKTPKKAVPEGDERDMQVRRLKSTSVPSKSSVDREIPTRPKSSGTERGPSTFPKREFKSKLPAPKVVLRPSHNAKPCKLAAVVKITKTQIPKMQTDAEETIVKGKMTKEEIKSKAKTSESEGADLEGTKLLQDQKSDDASHQEDLSNIKSTENGVKDEDMNDKEENDKQENDKQENGKQDSDKQEAGKQIKDDVQHTTEFEVSQNGKHEEKKTQIEAREESKIADSEDKHEKEDQQSESHTDTESYVVESTTSEISDVSEQPAESVEKEKSNEAATLEAPCVSYDSSITLKNVQIKLNDCLKDNSKTVEENIEQVSEPSYKDLSFGKTLRTIAGRRSLSRLRHVTFREQNRFSPNNSLFVNTSTTSQDNDFKVLRHRAGLTDNVSSNGTPLERKRKLYPEDFNPMKKPKTESESSFLNSSFDLLRNFRRPVQVSTPNTDVYKFQKDKLKLGKSSSVEIKADETPSANKWCTVM